MPIIALAAWLIEALGPEIMALIGLALIIPLMQALRAVVYGLPFIGQQLGNALGVVWNFFSGLIAQMERQLEYGANTILQIVGHAAIAVVGPAIDYVRSVATKAEAGVVTLTGSINAAWHYLGGWVTTNIYAALNGIAAININLAGIHTTVGGILTSLAHDAATLEWITVKAIPGIDTKIATLEKTAALVPAMATELATLHALSQEQIKQIAALTSAVATIDTTIGIDGRQIKTLMDQLTQLLPLAALSALGITAIGTLVKVAEDPCYCVGPEGALSDMPGRVLALENNVG